MICAASNFQRPYPALSVELQQLLGAQGYGYDMNVACSSATFAIINAVQAIRAGSAKVALVVNPEFASPQLNYKSRDSHFIFGDVCTATIIEAGKRVVTAKTHFVSSVPVRRPTFPTISAVMSVISTIVLGSWPKPIPYFSQEGRKVFKELLPIVAELILSHLDEMNLSQDELKRLWLHQANINMNVFAAKKILGRDKVEPHEAPLVLDEYANTASAGSIIAFP